jgi:hypothetical protein
MKINAVAVSQPGQRENLALVVESVNNSLFFQAPGNLLCRFQRFKFIDDLQSYEVFDFHLNRHATAFGLTVTAEIFLIFHPCRGPVDIDKRDRCSTHVFSSLYWAEIVARAGAKSNQLSAIGYRLSTFSNCVMNR